MSGTATPRRNRVTPEGWLLGKELARICDFAAALTGRDGRCNTCAFRAGDHLANGSPETLMSALKCALEREPFWCHESDRPCKGWLLTKSAKSHYDELAVQMPAAKASVTRWAQDIPNQVGSDRANAGGKTNGTMKAVGGPKQDGHSRRHAGFNERGDQGEADGETNETRLLRNYEPDLSPLVPPEVWNIATAAFSEAHFATFPPALVVPCLLAGCPVGGTVLDPFGGSGTTGLVADRMQRNAILIELNPKYAAMAERRLSGDRGDLLNAMEAA